MLVFLPNPGPNQAKFPRTQNLKTDRDKDDVDPGCNTDERQHCCCLKALKPKNLNLNSRRPKTLKTKNVLVYYHLQTLIYR